MAQSNHPNDPKGLIREAYRIDGISQAECRSIFLDWALSLPGGTDNAAAVSSMLQEYEKYAPDHPMTLILTDGLTSISAPRRRGGWRSRPRN